MPGCTYGHFICRSCFHFTCDRGVGLASPVCAWCGAASWLYAGSTREEPRELTGRLRQWVVEISLKAVDVTTRAAKV